MFSVLLVKYVSWLLDIYMWLIIAAVVISWVRPDPYNPIVRFLSTVTDPVLRPIRNMLAPYQRGWGLDFSPLVAILIIQFVRNVLLRSLV